MKHLPLAVNLVAYQCAWLACVFAAAQQRPWLGIGVAAATVAVHLWMAREPRRELVLIGITLVLGALVESALVVSGWVRSSDAALIGGSTPLMMVVLWGAFATTLNVAWRSLRDRPLLCALLAGIGAPLAYQAGEELGAMHWVSAGPALLLISVAWAVVMPLLLRTARRFDGFTPA